MKKKKTEVYPAGVLDTDVRIGEEINGHCCVRGPGGELLYPPEHVVYGNLYCSKTKRKYCETWVRHNCARQDDAVVEVSCCRALAELGIGEELNDMRVVVNECTCNGSMRNSYRCVFKSGRRYYSFHYYEEMGEIVIGQWNKGLDRLPDGMHLCRRVKRKTRTITQTYYE